MRSVKNLVEGVWVEFYERAVPDPDADSDTPAYKKAIYVRKKIPNSRNVVDQPMKAEDKLKYAELWRQFEAGEETKIDGWLIEQWPRVDVAQVESLKARNIYTVEMLAEMSDANLPAGYRDLKNKAIRDLSAGARVDELAKRVDEAQKEIAELRAENEELRANQKKKPGRPKKTESA